MNGKDIPAVAAGLLVGFGAFLATLQILQAVLS